jgi:hypothetical protein
MDHEKAFRKTAVNTGVAFLCLAASSLSYLIPDPTLAFMVSSISIAVACLASMFAFGWILWLQYLDGDLEGDYEPHSLHDLMSAGREWVADQYTRG